MHLLRIHVNLGEMLLLGAGQSRPSCSAIASQPAEGDARRDSMSIRKEGDDQVMDPRASFTQG